MAAPGWPGPCNTRIKVTSADQPARQPGSCNLALTVSCIVTQFAREGFGIWRFRGYFVYERIRLNLIKGRTIRKLMGGGAGEVQKKYSRKGKLNEKKFMHAN